MPLDWEQHLWVALDDNPVRWNLLVSLPKKKRVVWILAQVCVPVMSVEGLHFLRAKLGDAAVDSMIHEGGGSGDGGQEGEAGAERGRGGEDMGDGGQGG